MCEAVSKSRRWGCLIPVGYRLKHLSYNWVIGGSDSAVALGTPLQQSKMGIVGSPQLPFHVSTFTNKNTRLSGCMSVWWAGWLVIHLISFIYLSLSVEFLGFNITYICLSIYQHHIISTPIPISIALYLSIYTDWWNPMGPMPSEIMNYKNLTSTESCSNPQSRAMHVCGFSCWWITNAAT